MNRDRPFRDEALKVLRGAYDLLSDKKRWVKGTVAKNAYGDETGVGDGDAVKWCAAGAIGKVSVELFPEHDEAGYAFGGRVANAAEVLLTEALRATEGVDPYKELNIPQVNDGVRGYARIMAGFREALGLDGPDQGIAIVEDQPAPPTVTITGTITTTSTTERKDSLTNVPR